MVVNNAYDLCNWRLVQVQPVPRNSTLPKSFYLETSPMHMCAHCDIRTELDRTRSCYVHSCSSLRAALARYVSSHYFPYVDTIGHRSLRFFTPYLAYWVARKKFTFLPQNAHTIKYTVQVKTNLAVLRE